MPQVGLIVDHAGGHIYYTSATHPKWKLIPGNGIAVQTLGSYLGNACPRGWSCVADALPTVEIETGTHRKYEQTYWDTGWDGIWVRV